MNLLSAHSIGFSYPQRHVFTRWSADFTAGLNWVRGGNGSGKSTLLKLLCGALPLAHGDVRLGELSLGRDPIGFKRALFWCGPGPLPFDHLSPIGYLRFMRGLYPTLDEAQVERHVAGFGLRPHMHAKLRTLSTGTQRKVWLTAALSAGTTATLLDEPANALDATSLAHLLTVLAECAAQTSRTWVVVSHEGLGQAAGLASLVDLAPASA